MEPAENIVYLINNEEQYFNIIQKDIVMQKRSIIDQTVDGIRKILKMWILDGESSLINLIYNNLYQILLIITPLITSPYVSRAIGSNGGNLFYTYSIANTLLRLNAWCN